MQHVQCVDKHLFLNPIQQGSKRSVLIDRNRCIYFTQEGSTLIICSTVLCNIIWTPLNKCLKIRSNNPVSELPFISHTNYTYVYYTYILFQMQSWIDSRLNWFGNLTYMAVRFLYCTEKYVWIPPILLENSCVSLCFILLAHPGI